MSGGEFLLRWGRLDPDAVQAQLALDDADSSLTSDDQDAILTNLLATAVRTHTLQPATVGDVVTVKDILGSPFRFQPYGAESFEGGDPSGYVEVSNFAEVSFYCYAAGKWGIFTSGHANGWRLENGFPRRVHSYDAVLVTTDLTISSSEPQTKFTNRTAALDVKITLPFAVVGKRFYILRENPNYTLTLDCDSSERFEGFPNGVSRQIPSVGHQIVECLRTGVWSMISEFVPSIPINPITGRTIYLATTGSDANNGTAIGTPKLTLRGIQAIAQPGDTVTVAAGTYSGASNQINTANLPMGTEDFRISFTCATAFGARFPNITMTYARASAIAKYRWFLDFTNCVFTATALDDTTGENSIQAHDMRFFQCAFIAGTTVAGANKHTCVVGGGNDNYRGAKNVLLEDCVALGAGGRYKFLFYNAENCVGRRCVARWDQGWDSSGDIQCGDFGIYDSSRCEWQNCISLDDLAPATDPSVYKGAFFMEQNYYETSDIALRGCIAVNNQGPAFIGGSLTNNSTTVPSSGTSVPGAPPWNAHRKMRVNNWLVQDFAAAKVLHPSAHSIIAFDWNIGPLQVEGVTIADLNRAAAAGISFDNGAFPIRWLQGSTLSNCVSVYGAAGGAAHYGVEACVTQINNLSYASIVAANAAGLYHLPRADTGSTIGNLYGGANILKRIGASGSLYGEPAYKQTGDGTTPGGDLWPFPNQTAIKALFVELGGAPRGWISTGSTLTEYIWGILGTAGPP